MKHKGRARLDAILKLAAPWCQGVVADVGCDHGHTSRRLRDLGTADVVLSIERRSNRLPRRSDLDLVVSDGLTSIRRVDLAVITGMGPAAILGILTTRPRRAVVHSPDRTDTLRQRLADDGWRIDAEMLAPEGRGYAEVLRIEPGVEPHTGHTLWFGPKLHGDPLLPAHRDHVLAHWRRVAESAPAGTAGHARAAAWVAFLTAQDP